ncbi:MAG: transposase [Planctomycetaceae bacterium]|nr:transposase [Planctomycetaceae bacterium]
MFALAADHLGRDPLAGGLFVFVNRRRDRMKLAASTHIVLRGMSMPARRNCPCSWR